MSFAFGCEPAAGVTLCNIHNIPQQTFRTANPHAVPFALECRRMNIVVQNILELGAGEIRLVFGDVKFCQLDLGARIGMALRDMLPVKDGIVGFAQRRQRFGQRHHGVAVIVFRLFDA